MPSPVTYADYRQKVQRLPPRRLGPRDHSLSRSGRRPQRKRLTAGCASPGRPRGRAGRRQTHRAEQVVCSASLDCRGGSACRGAAEGAPIVTLHEVSWSTRWRPPRGSALPGATHSALSCSRCGARRRSHAWTPRPTPTRLTGFVPLLPASSFPLHTEDSTPMSDSKRSSPRSTAQGGAAAHRPLLEAGSITRRRGLDGGEDDLVPDRRRGFGQAIARATPRRSRGEPGRGACAGKVERVAAIMERYEVGAGGRPGRACETVQEVEDLLVGKRKVAMVVPASSPRPSGRRSEDRPPCARRGRGRAPAGGRS